MRWQGAGGRWEKETDRESVCGLEACAGVEKRLCAALETRHSKHVALVHPPHPPPTLTHFAPPQVEEFMLWDLERVASVISGSDDYKPNCCLVIIDFLIRHGHITPEEPGYLDLLQALRVGDPA